jgi:hypothetical protein
LETACSETAAPGRWPETASTDVANAWDFTTPL